MTSVTTTPTEVTAWGTVSSAPGLRSAIPTGLLPSPASDVAHIHVATVTPPVANPSPKARTTSEPTTTATAISATWVSRPAKNAVGRSRLGSVERKLSAKTASPTGTNGPNAKTTPATAETAAIHGLSGRWPPVPDKRSDATNTSTASTPMPATSSHPTSRVTVSVNASGDVRVIDSATAIGNSGRPPSAMAGVPGAAAMVIGGLLACFGIRWGAGLAGGAALAVVGWAR